MGPTKLTKAAAVHSHLLPRISSCGRRRMSTNAATSSASWTTTESTMLRRWPGPSSLHRLFATATLPSKGFCSFQWKVPYRGHSRLSSMNYLASQNRSNAAGTVSSRSEEHTSELQSRQYLVCRLLLEKKQILLYQSLSH